MLLPFQRFLSIMLDYKLMSGVKAPGVCRHIQQLTLKPADYKHLAKGNLRPEPASNTITLHTTNQSQFTLTPRCLWIVHSGIWCTESELSHPIISTITITITHTHTHTIWTHFTFLLGQVVTCSTFNIGKQFIWISICLAKPIFIVCYIFTESWIVCAL